MKYFAFVLLLILLSLQFRIWVGDGGVPEVWRLQRQIEVQREANAEYRERNLRLYAEVRDLKAGNEAIEERARREMGMIRKGETYYQLVDQ